MRIFSFDKLLCYYHKKQPRLILQESEPFLLSKALILIVRFTRVLCRLRCVHHSCYWPVLCTSLCASCSPVAHSPSYHLHKLCLTVTIITVEPLLTLVCVSISSARRSFYVPLLWKDLCLFLMSHSRKIIVASTLFGVFYIHIISVDSGINSTYRNNHL